MVIRFGYRFADVYPRTALHSRCASLDPLTLALMHPVNTIVHILPVGLTMGATGRLHLPCMPVQGQREVEGMLA
jgi:hypothetical protein